METIEIIVEETVQPIILEVYQETTPPIVLESFEGQPGDSAYVEAVKNGFVGTESEWLESLKGDKGDVGEKGDKGDIGEKGEKGDKGDSGANAVWGDITGSLNDQVDLQNALDSKVDEVTGYSLTKNDLTDALKTAYDNAVSGLATLLATGSRLITSGEITKLSNTSGTNTGDQDLSGKVDKVSGKSLILDTEITRLGTMATNANVGVVPNTLITGATKTKITYDAKGLVTAGADATTADIADSTNKRYVTDANAIKINAIDQSVSSIEKSTWNSKQDALGYTPENTTNKTTSTSDSASTTKFPVFATILAYFDTSRIRTLLGISTLSGSNTGDETNATIISKLGYTPTRTFLSGSDGTTVSNTTTITPTYTQLIQAGTFVAGDVIDLLFRAISTIAKSSASSIYVYVNTTNSLATGSPLQVAILTNALRTLQMTRTMSVKGSTTRVTTSTTSANADVVLTGASTLLTINWAIDQYFIFAIGHTVASATESLTGDCFRITKN